MKKKNITSGLVLTFAAMLMSSGIWAQQSPPATAKGTAGGAAITINYNSPFVKGRKIWGDLVPYGKAWRGGADKATTIQTDKAIKIEGKQVAAGTYSVFLVPGETEWTVILNSETGQWGIKRSGEANFDPAKNVASVNVKPRKSASFNESLAYAVTDSGFVLRWENVEVPVSITKGGATH